MGEERSLTIARQLCWSYTARSNYLGTDFAMLSEVASCNQFPVVGETRHMSRLLPGAGNAEEHGSEAPNTATEYRYPEHDVLIPTPVSRQHEQRSDAHREKNDPKGDPGYFVSFRVHVGTPHSPL